MRKCLRCENEMVENLEVMVSNGAYGVEVREKGLLKCSLSKLKCAVCPQCGYTETYIEDTEKIKQLVKNKPVAKQENNIINEDLKTDVANKEILPKGRNAGYFIYNTSQFNNEEDREIIELDKNN